MSKRSLEDIERATVERLDASPVKIHKSEAAQDGKALDVLVVGAGPTGLFLANDLARRLSQNNGRTKVRVIDGAKGPSTHSKALAVQVRTMELYDDLGIAHEAERLGMHTTAMCGILGPGREYRVAFTEGVGDACAWPFMLILPQSQNEAILRKNLEGHSLRVEYGTKLVALTQASPAPGVEVGGEVGPWTATLELTDGTREIVAARHVVGADGAHSAVRHALGLPFLGKRYEEEFVLCDCTMLHQGSMGKYLKPGEAMFCYDPTNKQFVLIFTFSDGTYRVMAVRDDGRSGEPASLGDIQAALDILPIKLEAKDPTWLTQFRLHARAAQRYANLTGPPSAFVAGDAAHIHSPVGGQGMNTGLQDAYNLGWKLGMVVGGNAGPGLLATYDEERHPVGVALLRSTDAAFGAMVSNAAWFRVAKAILFSFLGKRYLMPRLERIMPKAVSMLHITYRGSSLAMDALPRWWLRSRPLLAGDRVPFVKRMHHIALRSGNAKGSRRKGAVPASASRANPNTHPSVPTKLCSTHDLMRGPNFTLLVVCSTVKDCEALLWRKDPSTPHIMEACQSLRRNPGVHYVLILLNLVTLTDVRATIDAMPAIGRDARIADAVYSPDDRAEFVRSFGIESGLVLIRPDMHVGYIEQSGQRSRLAEYVKERLHCG